MNYKISKPSAYLSQYIKQYWSLENCIPSGREHIQRIVPSGLFEMIFYLKDKPLALDSQKTINEKIVVTGQLKGFYDLKIGGQLSLFAIYFLPHGLSMFLNLPIRELYNHSIPLKMLLKDKVNQLEDELSSAVTFEQRISIAEKFLFKQIRFNEKKEKFKRIQNMVHYINQKRGVLNIEDLASISFLSRKQFERTFSDFVGTTPKHFLRIVRFQNAIYEKSGKTELSLTEIAHKCGYYDQSHMINDFKGLTGMAPKNFFGEEDVFSDYFD